MGIRRSVGGLSGQAVAADNVLPFADGDSGGDRVVLSSPGSSSSSWAGRPGLFEVMELAQRYQTRVNGYLFLLTDAYPWYQEETAEDPAPWPGAAR
jgi:hypothetical protein